LTHLAPGDWFDPVLEEDVVQPSNERQRAAPPEELAASHTTHIGERTAAPSKYSPCDWPTLFERVVPRLFNTAHVVV